MDDDNIEFLRDFIGRNWLEAEFDKINTKSPLKGAGSHFAPYHPWVHFKYELEYLLRRANVESHKDVVMGKYHYILSNAGMLLKRNFNYIIDKKDAQKKLRNPEQFYDFIWELEVRTMISQRGANASFVDPKSGSTYDGIAVIIDNHIPYECKNKVIDDEQYNTNMAFLQVLANKLGDIPSVQNKIIQIEFENGRLEDIKVIAAIIRDKFDVFDYQSILGRYKVRTLKKVPFSTPVQYLINREGINQVFQINERKKNELYLDEAPSNIVKTKILIKMPDQVCELQNLNGVLKKANKQLPPGGIVFLQVPYITFESAKMEATKELSQSFSNISAVKIISLKIESYENQGVKISRLEDLVISTRGKKPLSQKEVIFFNQPMAFSKYAPES